LKAQHVLSGILLIIRSSKLYLQPLVYIPMWWPAWVPTQPAQWPITAWVYKPEAANTVWSSWWWAVCRLKHVEPSINFGIINSITRLHLVGYFYWFILWCMDPWILNLKLCMDCSLLGSGPVWSCGNHPPITATVPQKTTTEVFTTMQISYLTLAWSFQLMCFDTQVTFPKIAFKNNMTSSHVCRTL
jgi:hypothetical protein